jgi:hypothetical protein
MTGRPDDLAPETVNNEQDEDAGTQAQAVMDEARHHSLSVMSLEQSEKLSSSLNSAQTQDLVEHMRQMDTSGTIDMSAYSGEETHDDLEGRYGRAAAADPDLAGDDS